jgi:hypothetical protein
MKRLVHILLLSTILTGCASLPDIRQFIATPTSVPVDTSTPQPTVTLIPTKDLFATSTSTPITFTPTDTPLVPEAAPTDTPTPRPTFALPSNLIGGDYFTPKNEGFLAVLISNNIIYWNEGPCMPRNVKISAFVEDLLNTHTVLLFLRLREKRNTLNVGEWSSGAIMTKAENGSFNYDVRTFNLRRYHYYREAWLEYQLVALTENNEVIGRTQIYDRNISLVRCQPVAP